MAAKMKARPKVRATEADFEKLAAIGAALIGLSVGDVFRWEAPDARLREIEVLSIED